jgi:ketosteroid isomerase-like protein
LAALSSEQMLAVMTEDAAIAMPFAFGAMPTLTEGGKAVVGPFLTQALPMWTSFAIGRCEIEPMPGSGRVLVEWESDAVMANGNPYRNTYICVADIRDGLIARWTEYFNPRVLADSAPELSAGPA